MKNSILGFGGVMMLCLVVCSCMKEHEDVKLPEDGVNLKVAVDDRKQEADQRGTYNVTHLLNYLHAYIKNQVSEDFKYYENIPERKEADWFFENFTNHLNEEREADKWVLDEIQSGEIQIFGTTVRNVQVTALIFSEGLEIHEQFDGKKGIFFDSNRYEDCFMWSEIGEQWGENCFCHMIYSCHDWGWCWPCANVNQDFNFEKIIDLDQWVIEDYDFEMLGSVPVSKIDIGDPVLQLERR